MNKTFNLLFYVKKAKINFLGESPIYLRITIDGKISEISTKRTILDQDQKLGTRQKVWII